MLFRRSRHRAHAGFACRATSASIASLLGLTLALHGHAEATAPATEQSAEAGAVPVTAPASASMSSSDASEPTADSAALPTTTGLPPPSDEELRLTREAAARAERRARDGEIDMRQRQVGAIEDDFSGFDPRLVNALVALGDALHGVGRNNEALGVLERAQHVSRVTDGLYNLEQLKVIDSLAPVLSALNRWPEAIQAKEYALMLVRRAHGVGSPQMVTQLYDLANWYESVGHVFGARQAYEHAAVIIDAKVGDSDPKRAEAMRKLAHSYRLERFPEHRLHEEEQRFNVDYGGPPLVSGERRVGALNRFGPGEGALKEAIRIYQRQQPADTANTAATLIELGDWYLLFNKLDLATLAYREAQGQLARMPARPADPFAQPHPVYFRPPALPARPPLDAIPEYSGYVELGFDVSEQGEVTNVQLISANPVDLLTEPVLKAMRKARYRPRLDAAGNAVPSTGQLFRFEFPYYQQTQAGS